MNKRRAITMIELLVCLAIIAIVAGISYPVFVTARFSAKIASAQQNLRQHFFAISLYQADQDAIVHIGSPSSMGLPSIAVPSSLNYAARNMPAGSKWSPCGSPNIDKIPTEWWLIYRPFDEETWQSSLEKLDYGVRLMYDTNCDYPTSKIGDSADKHRAFAVTLNGNIVTKVAIGNPTKPGFWGE